MINKILKFFNIRTNKEDIWLVINIINDYKLALKDAIHYDWGYSSHQYKELGICYYSFSKYNKLIYDGIDKWINKNKIYYPHTNIISGYFCAPGNIVDRIPIIERLLKDLIKDKHFKIIS